MIARAIANAEGFKPTQLFMQSSDFERSGRWLSAVKPQPESKPA